ncbi:MAG: Diaminopimelate epimerase [Bacteroidota bacterium]|jgi:diaminopimelate epimerase
MLNQKLIFHKYQATGNDFIIVDDRQGLFPKENTELIKKLCHRRFGIGADGLMLLQKSETTDFKMWYANSDGNQSTMCGNGGRSIAAFAKSLSIINNETTFEAIDGNHKAIIETNDLVNLQMCNIDSIDELKSNRYRTNSGSPHLVWFVDNTNEYPVFEIGRDVQKSTEYKAEGINVNFIEEVNTSENLINIRTYERGVEDETLSCGTGATAAAICYLKKNKIQNGAHTITLNTMGGILKVTCNKLSDTTYNDIWLSGKATFVFKGEIDL